MTGANERIFKSPIPLLYTRLLSRFLTAFLLLLPLALWQASGESQTAGQHQLPTPSFASPLPLSLATSVHTRGGLVVRRRELDSAR